MTAAARLVILMVLTSLFVPGVASACLKGDECDSGCCRGTQCQSADVCGSAVAPLFSAPAKETRRFTPAWVWAGLAAFAAAGAAAVRRRGKRREAANKGPN